MTWGAFFVSGYATQYKCLNEEKTASRERSEHLIKGGRFLFNTSPERSEDLIKNQSLERK